MTEHNTQPVTAIEEARVMIAVCGCGQVVVVVGGRGETAGHGAVGEPFPCHACGNEATFTQVIDGRALVIETDE